MKKIISKKNNIWQKLFLTITFSLFLLNSNVFSQNQNYARLPITRENWTKSFPPFRVVGNLYYVGGYDLSVYLITTEEGHILINTGVYDSAKEIKSNVESLGFKFSDIKILLTMQAHWDHVADLAGIKRQTNAKLFAHKDDAPVLENGGIHQFFNSNPFKFSKMFCGAVFEPVKVDRRLKHGNKIKLGKTTLKLHHHPGHTRGASSFTFDTFDKGKKYRVLIVNMGSVNTSRGVKLTGMQLFPNIAKAYAKTFSRQKELEFDVWVSSHAGHFNLHEKYKPDDKYNPQRFVDPEGYKAKITLYESTYLEKLRKEREEKISQFSLSNKIFNVGEILLH